jgi:DNA-binding MarR family transcriptional regulator
MSMLKLPPTRLARFADSVGFRLRRAHEAAQQRFAAGLASTGLLPIHAEVLAMISDNPGTIPSVVAEAIGRDRSSITGILHTLRELGLIERARTTRDRRAALLHLTAAGEAMLSDIQRFSEARDAALDRILAEDKPAFLAQLRRIIAVLDAPNEEEGDASHEL